MAINCCRYCVAPKRHPGCHDRCAEYIDEKAHHDRLKAADDKRKFVEYGIISQCIDAIYRATKKKG